MKIDHVKLSGFRNFNNARINFSKNTLVIGGNDVGKTNLMHALRMLLDKSLSELDIEPTELDFHIAPDGQQSETFEITIAFSDVQKDAVLSVLKGHVSDENHTFFRYVGQRNDLSYTLYVGYSLDDLEEVSSRFYLKHLSLKYIHSQRDLQKFIQREKRHLLKISQEDLEKEQKTQDVDRLAGIGHSLNHINSEVSQLNYVANATSQVNQELQSLAHHHSDYTVHLDSGAIQVNQFIDKLELGANTNGSQVMLGGDGRNNQILLALWKAKSVREHDLNSEVVFYCVEEPEAHLHPHQQRKLARYLTDELPGQSIITSHSPQITGKYKPDSIIRLLNSTGATRAANEGCSDCISGAWDDMGYRISILPAEAFFSSSVLLVEGPSEMLFYTTLADKLSIDLDYLNISILSVDGVQFEVYTKILDAMEIPWAMRTDNDVSKVKNHPGRMRCAGMNRCLRAAGVFAPGSVNAPEGQDLYYEEPSLTSQILVDRGCWFEISKAVNPRGIFLAKKDLENDLALELSAQICEFANKPGDIDAAVKYLQGQKAVRMRRFLTEYSTALSNIAAGELAKPLFYCWEQVTGA
ncbi:MAG: ATP-dependent nuclease [Endozoicomonas sp.]|uniref:ATP-dependent nuclease n=1 Tax=Endozoicomonas sp. TaxID=1892382 RepID=UPI003D9BD9AC